MKCLMKNLIILFALIFLGLLLFVSNVYKSYDKEANNLRSKEVRNEVRYEKQNDKVNKNFEILQVTSDKKKQMEESLGYEIAEVKHIRLLDKDDYTKEDVNNKEAYTIQNISEVKDALEFDGRDVYELTYKNKKYKGARIKIGKKILKNDYMVDLPIDAKIISNGLGFDVKEKHKIDLNLEEKIEGKAFATLSLFPEINHYDFEVHKNGREVSKGTAKKVVGAYIIVRKDERNEI